MRTLAAGAALTLALAAHAQAHGHGGARSIALHHGVGAPAVSLRAAISTPQHDRNIRSGDHFGWRQGYPRS